MTPPDMRDVGVFHKHDHVRFFKTNAWPVSAGKRRTASYLFAKQDCRRTDIAFCGQLFRMITK
jgi:hypothetical protein